MTAFKTTILFSSWLVVSALGGAFLHSYWSAKGLPVQAITRPMVFVAIMGCVHFVGYCIYANQHFGLRWFSILLAPEYKSAFVSSVTQQLVAGVLAVLMLDRGLLMHCWLISVLAFWLVVVLIVTRRPSMPSSLDVNIVRYAFLAIFLVVAFVGPVVWRSLGVL